jgi:hypothetical protein
MNPTTNAALLVGSIVLGVAIVLFALGYVVDRLAKRSVTKRIGRLRSAGTIPPANAASDADIIRLANENKREAAALLYVSLHKVNLGKARLVVGSPSVSNRFMAITGAFLLLFCFLCVARLENQIVLAMIWIANIFIFTAAYMKSRSLIAKNRKTLAKGQMPSPDASAWKEPVKAA